MNITLFGLQKDGIGGVSRYVQNLTDNMDITDYIVLHKREIIKNNKKHFGYISSLLYQPFYHIKSDVIHSLNGTIIFNL